ncbi:MAG: tRNA (adenosine(37)-N6)-dimethylallyltransferase MiaA [Clostridia bacterium]|nr:tRNA (adenosine(37)-N6)-dimethylallyltransferase MiaA [Clostridia bacterium]
MNRLVAIAGTNASGKSALAVEMALRFGGEVVSADSRQVYAGLDLGSGKITPEETKGVRHHLLDVRQPGEFFSMADFQRLAYAAIDDIIARGKLPILAGGTGLYVECVTKGYLLSDRAPDLAYREELEKLTTPELYEMLIKALPDIEIDRYNRNRVMRVLEKLHDGDAAQPAACPRYDVLTLGVIPDRETLKTRIDERLERRMRAGMVDEVARLRREGEMDAFLLGLGLEYRYITEYLRGAYPDEQTMTRELSLAIKRFAKRQVTWFKRDKSIKMLDMNGDYTSEAAALISGFLKGDRHEPY